MERRLAAILAADVVGYSRLMERDEAGTLTALKSHRKEVLQPLVALHRGRVFKIAGDGTFEATRCGPAAALSRPGCARRSRAA